MALGLSYRCACGKKYKIYMPKHKLFGEIVSRAVDWFAVDAREQAEGEVEEVKRLAHMSRCTYVDGGSTERLTCTECAQEIDLKTHFRSHLVKI